MPSLKKAEKHAKTSGNSMSREKRDLLELESEMKAIYELETEIRDRIEALDWGIDEEVHLAKKRKEREALVNTMVPFIIKVFIISRLIFRLMLLVH